MWLCWVLKGCFHSRGLCKPAACLWRGDWEEGESTNLSANHGTDVWVLQQLGDALAWLAVE